MPLRHPPLYDDAMTDARAVVLVTGATDGIGQETAAQLVRRGGLTVPRANPVG